MTLFDHCAESYEGVQARYVPDASADPSVGVDVGLLYEALNKLPDKELKQRAIKKKTF